MSSGSVLLAVTSGIKPYVVLTLPNFFLFEQNIVTKFQLLLQRATAYWRPRFADHVIITLTVVMRFGCCNCTRAIFDRLKFVECTDKKAGLYWQNPYRTPSSVTI